MIISPDELSRYWIIVGLSFYLFAAIFMSAVHIVDVFITHFCLVQHSGKRAHLLSLLGSRIPDKSCGTFLRSPVLFLSDNLAESYRLDDRFYFFFFKAE